MPSFMNAPVINRHSMITHLAFDFVLDVKNSLYFFRSTIFKETRNLETEIVLFSSLI